MADADALPVWVEMHQHALEAIACAKDAITIAERLRERIRELDPPPEEGSELLTFRVPVPTVLLLPGSDFDLEEMFGLLRDAMRQAVAVKRAELAQ